MSRSTVVRVWCVCNHAGVRPHRQVPRNFSASPPAHAPSPRSVFQGLPLVCGGNSTVGTAPRKAELGPLHQRQSHTWPSLVFHSTFGERFAREQDCSCWTTASILLGLSHFPLTRDCGAAGRALRPAVEASVPADRSAAAKPGCPASLGRVRLSPLPGSPVTRRLLLAAHFLSIPDAIGTRARAWRSLGATARAPLSQGPVQAGVQLGWMRGVTRAPIGPPGIFSALSPQGDFPTWRPVTQLLWASRPHVANIERTRDSVSGRPRALRGALGGLPGGRGVWGGGCAPPGKRQSPSSGKHGFT